MALVTGPRPLVGDEAESVPSAGGEALRRGSRQGWEGKATSQEEEEKPERADSRVFHAILSCKHFYLSSTIEECLTRLEGPDRPFSDSWGRTA